MSTEAEVRQLAQYLLMLKDRTGRSFDVLGRRAGVSGSSLHRYCAGSSVPAEFASLLAFGKACGASRTELRELQRLWVLADASRDRTRETADRQGEEETGPDDGPDPDRAEPDSAEAAPIGVATRGGPDLPDDFGSRQVLRRSKVALLAVVTLVVLLGVATGTSIWATDPGRSTEASHQDTGDDGPLFSPACAGAMGQGQIDDCVREVQRLLKEAGGRLAVDGSFGPETLRRVTAFQVLAGLPVSGVVDEATKRALYDRKVSLLTWSPARVEHRIREVFVERPDQAVAIADCQSYLDPHWSQPNPNGSRNWGVFQISEYRLNQFKASPRQALDPEWNIQAAYRLWQVRPDFGDWPNCARAARLLQSPTPTP